MAKAARWTTTDAEERKLGEQTGLDTLVVLALNDQDLGCRPFGRRPGANALSPAPGEYGRKTETQRIDGGPHKRWNMWFNSTLREEPYLGSKC